MINQGERELREKLDQDLLASPSRRVLYLEGPTDVDIFSALLGVQREAGEVYDRILVKDVGSRSAVQKRVELAVRLAASAKQRASQYAGVFGIIDGDGAPLGELAPHFDPPCTGPLFRWKAYCIENLLALSAWPPSFGDPPDWPAELLRYQAYVALNRTHDLLQRELRKSMAAMGIENYHDPSLTVPLKSAEEVAAILEQNRQELARHDVGDMFRRQVRVFTDAIAAGLPEAHALLNGKWLVEHLAPSRTALGKQECRDRWVEHVRAQGGHGEVRAFWGRMTQRPTGSTRAA